MLVERWSSDAFLTYIEKEVKEFTKGVSTKMLKHDTFFNVPTINGAHSPHKSNHEKTTIAEPT